MNLRFATVSLHLSQLMPKGGVDVNEEKMVLLVSSEIELSWNSRLLQRAVSGRGLC